MTEAVPLMCWLPAVVEAVRARFAGNPRTADKVAAETQRLFRYLAAVGILDWLDAIPEPVQEWCWAARRDRSGRHQRTAPSTARNRQWAALAAFEEAAKLGAPIDPAALIGARIARSSPAVSARPLTDGEDDQVRAYGDAGLVASRRSVMLAISYAGGHRQRSRSSADGRRRPSTPPPSRSLVPRRASGHSTNGALRRFSGSCATTRQYPSTVCCASPPLPVPLGPRMRWRCASGRFCEMRGCRGGPA